MLQFLLSIADESDHAKIMYIYDKYHIDMIRFARCRLKIMGCRNYMLDAEDVVQSAFWKITKYISSINFNASDKEIKSYVFSIASNAIIDEMKEQEYFENIDDYTNTASDDDFVRDLMIRERYDEVIAVIERMDEKYRQALLFRFEKGHSIKEMADIFGVPEKTVYTRISRAQKLLREMLNEGK